MKRGARASAWRSVQPGVTINPVPSVIQREASRGAQRVVNYLGAMGAAGLASLEGELLLSSVKDETERLARVAGLVVDAAVQREPDIGEPGGHPQAPSERFHRKIGSAEGRGDNSHPLRSSDLPVQSFSSVARIASLDAPGPCTYYARVGQSCVVFVVVDEGMAPAAVTERLGRAIAVFDRVMGVRWAAPGGGSGGGPDGALDFAEVPRATARRSAPR